MDEMVALLGDHPHVYSLNSSFWSDYQKTSAFSWLMQRSKTTISWLNGLITSGQAEIWSPYLLQKQRTPSSQKQSKSRAQGFAQKSNRLCYYHRTFGEAAQQCRQPCTWPGNDKASR
jgi:hypothetical protein